MKLWQSAIGLSEANHSLRSVHPLDRFATLATMEAVRPVDWLVMPAGLGRGPVCLTIWQSGIG